MPSAVLMDYSHLERCSASTPALPLTGYPRCYWAATQALSSVGLRLALPASLPLGRYFHTPLDRMSTPTPIGSTCQFPTGQVFPHSPQLDVLCPYPGHIYTLLLYCVCDCLGSQSRAGRDFSKSNKYSADRASRGAAESDIGSTRGRPS